MIELTMYNARKHFGDTRVLFDASFQVFEGDKAGIVGANGCGKSTILKLIAGIELMDIDYRRICEGKSRITYPKGTKIGYLEQLPDYPDKFSVKEVLNLAFLELDKIEAQLKILECKMGQSEGEALEIVFKQYGQLQQDYDSKGGYNKEEKLSRVCLGLKFNDSFLSKDFNVLSGGEKTTVLLGKTLLENPDILLLDEPTNHLDMDSVEWLESYLKSYRGIVLIVSHDRYFLDNVVTKIIEVENNACETFKSNYSDYEKQKEEKILLQFENYKEQKKKINSMENIIRDLREWALKADNSKFFRRAASIQRKLDKMERINKPVLQKQKIKLNFTDVKQSGYEVIKANGLSKTIDNRVIFSNTDLYITLGERVALIGANGSGKTTLIKMLLGEVDLDSGNVKLGASLKIAYLPQTVIFNNHEDTVIQCFRENRIIQEGKAREYLAKFMFFGKEPYKKVKHLSGGERVRLKLSMLLFEEVNLLILDEPTNHLDIDSIEALEQALEEFNGTILFISHDRYFINNICSRIVAIEENKLVDYQGNYDFYKNRKDEATQTEDQSKKIKSKAIVEALDKVANKASVIIDENKRGIAFSRLESSIKAIEEEKILIEMSMSEQETNYDELNKLYLRREELDKMLDELIEQGLTMISE